ncbi:hypothetical protein D5086_015524 [Populus alba]|uniref:Uncharacterized protein n=1 Tax=Populus alba TaxID=43335 RepID=A0ACC4BRZ2_POPAL
MAMAPSPPCIHIFFASILLLSNFNQGFSSSPSTLQENHSNGSYSGQINSNSVLVALLDSHYTELAELVEKALLLQTLEDAVAVKPEGAPEVDPRTHRLKKPAPPAKPGSAPVLPIYDAMAPGPSLAPAPAPGPATEMGRLVSEGYVLTVLAPNDEAMAKLTTDQLSEPGAPEQIIYYHVIPEYQTEESMYNAVRRFGKISYDTLRLPHKVLAQEADGSVKFGHAENSAYLFDPDIYTDGRISVQGIDGVLFPLEEKEKSDTKTEMKSVKVAAKPQRRVTVHLPGLISIWADISVSVQILRCLEVPILWTSLGVNFNDDRYFGFSKKVPVVALAEKGWVLAFGLGIGMGDSVRKNCTDLSHGRLGQLHGGYALHAIAPLECLMALFSMHDKIKYQYKCMLGSCLKWLAGCSGRLGKIHISPHASELLRSCKVLVSEFSSLQIGSSFSHGKPTTKGEMGSWCDDVLIVFVLLKFHDCIGRKGSLSLVFEAL